MFSRTTIESSTTRPIAMVSAPRVSMFSERSRVQSTISARTIESGMDTAVTSVERIDARKTRITTTAKSRPSAPSVVRPEIDLETAGPWSETTVSSAPAPRSLRRPGSLSWTASEMATALPSLSMVAMTARLGLPLVRVRETAVAGSCFTVATSPTRTGLPPSPVAGFCATTLRSSICWSEVKEPPTWMVRLLPDSEKDPAGTVAPAAWRAWDSEPAFSPAAASLPSSGTTEIWSSWTPSTETWPTPSMSSSAGTTVRSSSSASACWSLSEVTARTTVGMSSVEPATTCGSTESGSWTRARFTACWMSATSCFVPSSPKSKLAMMTALPSLAVEVMPSTPSTALMAFSRGSTTCFSTTSGDAPW